MADKEENKTAKGNDANKPFIAPDEMASLNVSDQKINDDISNKPISNLSSLTYLDKPTPQAAAPKKITFWSSFSLPKLALSGLGVFILLGLSGYGIKAALTSNKTSNINSSENVRTVALSVPATPLTATNATTSQLGLNGDVSIQGNLSVTGNANISGNLSAASLSGSGTGITNLNASNLTSGQINTNLLPSNVTLLGQTIPLSALQPKVVSSINGVINNGANINITGNNIVVTPNQANNSIDLSLAPSVGTITGVTAGTGLTGGGTSGNVSLSLENTVTVQGNSFNGANQLVQLGSDGKLTNLNGSNLTNLNGNNIKTGSVPDSALSSNVCLGSTNSCNYQAKGSYVNLQSSSPSTQQIGSIDVSGTVAGSFFVGDGNQISNVNANNITIGQINNLRLSDSVTKQGNTFNGASQLVQTTALGYLPGLNGSLVTNLNADNIKSGTLSDSRLSSNVALLNASNTFTGTNNDFTGNINTNNLQSTSGTLNIGSISNPLVLQGSSITLKQDGSGTVTYTLPSGVDGKSYEVCTTLGNCGTGSSTIVGTGTANKLTKFTGSQSIGDSSISDIGTLVTLSTNTLAKPTTNSTNTFVIQNSSSNPLFTADTSNMRIGIGTSTPAFPLDVNGNINSATGIYVNGTKVCDSTGCGSSGGSGFYIQNGTSTQTDANFNIQSSAANKPVAVLKGASGQTSDLLDLQNSGGTNVASFSPSGNLNIVGTYQINGSQISSSNLSDASNLTYLNANNTLSGNNILSGTTSFTGNIIQKGANANILQIQNSSGNDLFNADTTNMRIGINTNSPQYSLDVNGSINISSGSNYLINGQPICSGSNLCAPSSSSPYYIQNSTTTQSSANLNIQSASAASVTAVLQGASSQSADILDIRTSGGNTVAGFGSNGALTLGMSSVQSGNLIFKNSSNANKVTLVPQTSGSSNGVITVPNETGQICTTAGSKACTDVYAAASVSGAYVNLQSSSPSTQQIGSIDVSGTVAGSFFVGDGNQISNVNANNIKSGTLSDSRLSDSVTLQGNTFNGASQLVQTTALGYLPGLNGSLVTNLNADNIKSGTLSDLRLSNSVTLQGNTFNGASQLVQTTALGYLPAVNASLLTSLSGGNITPSSIPNSALAYNSVTINNGTNISGGSTVALGSSITIATVANPTFSTSVTTPSVTNGSNNLSLQGNGNTLTISNTGFNFGTGNITAGTYNGQTIGTSTVTLAGTTSINTSGSYNTNINTGTNSGTVNIGNSSTSTNVYGSVSLSGTVAGSNSFSLNNSTSGNAIFTESQTYNSSNIIQNYSFESTNTQYPTQINNTGWSNWGTASSSVDNTSSFSGSNSLKVTSTAVNGGVNYNTALSNSTNYQLSFFAKANSSTVTGVQFGYGTSASSTTPCSTNAINGLSTTSVSSSGWFQFSCNFTTPAAGTNYLFISSTNAGEIYNIDAIQLLPNSTNVAFNPYGQIALNGVITGSTILQNIVNSTSAFAIYNASGTSLLQADTANLQIVVGSGSNNVAISASNGLVLSGTAQRIRSIVLTPEYAGAVLDNSNYSGTSTGTMTAGFDSSVIGLNGSNSYGESYYLWTNSQTSAQSYDIIVRVPLPSDFASFNGTNPISFNTRGTTGASITAYMWDTGSTTSESNWSATGSGCNVPVNASWSNQSGCTVNGTNVADGVITLRIKLTAAANGGTVQLGNTTIKYKSKW